MTPRDDLIPLEVAAHLLPVRAYDHACELAIDHLATVAPMGMWAATRVLNGNQTLLAAHGDGYPVRPGMTVPFGNTLCSRMVSGRAPQIAPDVARTPGYSDLEDVPLIVRAYVGTPVVTPDGELFGTVCGFDPDPQPESLRVHQPLLDLLSSLLSAVLAGDLQATVAARALEAARGEADVDALTGLLNRRGWDRYLRQEEERFRRFGDLACVVAIDLDRLKLVNDTQGHEAGDRYIRRAADALARAVRDTDVLARLGGDEFGIVAVGSTREQAAELVARADRALAASGVSGSIGFAPYGVAAGFQGAWRAADAAMYEQKRARRSPPAAPSAARRPDLEGLDLQVRGPRGRNTQCADPQGPTPQGTGPTGVRTVSA